MAWTGTLPHRHSSRWTIQTGLPLVVCSFFPILLLCSVTLFFSRYFFYLHQKRVSSCPCLLVSCLQSSYPSGRLLQFSIRAALPLNNSSSQKGENTWQAGSQNWVVTNFTCNRFYTVLLFVPCPCQILEPHFPPLRHSPSLHFLP